MHYFIGFDESENSIDGRFLSYQTLLQNGYEARSTGYPSIDTVQTVNSSKKLCFYDNAQSRTEYTYTAQDMISALQKARYSFIRHQKSLCVGGFYHPSVLMCSVLHSIYVKGTLCICDDMHAILKCMQNEKPHSVFLHASLLQALCRWLKTVMQQKLKESDQRIFASLAPVMKALPPILRRNLTANINRILGGKLQDIICYGTPIDRDTVTFFSQIGIKIIDISY